MLYQTQTLPPPVEQAANPQAANPYEDLLTIDEVARYLRVDPTTVRRWINDGILSAVALPHVSKRKSYRVKRGELDRLLQEA